MEGKRQRHRDSVQLVRQWALLQILVRARRGLSVKDLSERLRTSKSSIDRDLATLERHFPLVEELDGKQRRRYRINLPAGEPGIRFTPLELLALTAVEMLAGPTLGATLEDELRGLVRKVRALTPQAESPRDGRMSQVYLAHPRGRVDYSQHQDVVDAVLDGILRRRICRGNYRSAWEAPAHEVEIWPLRMIGHDGALYLIAWTPTRERLSTYAVHRFSTLEVSTRQFTARNIDPEEESRAAFGIFSQPGDEEEVEVIFSRAFAWKIEERVFHPGEIKQRLPDGRLRYRVKTSGKWEVIGWVLAYGGEAELTAPAEWRRELHERGAALANVHNQSNRGPG